MDIIGLFVFIFGGMIGSFLNVCIVRLPKEKSIVFPNSHCVHCQKPIVWHDNIPLFSWILLGGKCRSCKAKISFRYFIVELLTALVFFGFYQRFGLVPVLGPYLVMVSCFIVATFVDFAERIIPDEVSIGGMFAGIALSIIVPALHPMTVEDSMLAGFGAGLIVLICLGLMAVYPIFCRHLMDPNDDPSADRSLKLLVTASLLLICVINLSVSHMPHVLLPYMLSFSSALSGYIIGGGVIYMLGLLGDIVFKKESMGGGDIKLMAMVGAFLGWKLALLAFFIAPFFGAIFGIIEKIRTKDSAFAYGPFLVMASLVSLFWGEQIIEWILKGGLSL